MVSFEQPPGSSTQHNDPTAALGPDDNAFVSIDIPETLIGAFPVKVRNVVGDDIRIREYGNDASHARVSGSEDGTLWTFLTEAVAVGEFTDIFIDLSASGLSNLNFLKFEGLDNAGGSAGFDIDAVEGAVPIPGAVWLLGSGLVCLVGLKKKFKR